MTIAADSKSSRAQATITRPSNTTGYAAGDVVSTTAGAILSFTLLALQKGGSVVVNNARVTTDKQDCTATLRLHLFQESPTAIADNAAFDLAYADDDIYLGFLTFEALESNGTSTASAQASPAKLLQLASADQGIYGILETVDAFTPASGQLFEITLDCDPNCASGGGGDVRSPSFGAGAVSAGTTRVVLATDTTVPNVTGNVAHAAADSGNPIKIGGKAETTQPTAVADGQRVDGFFDEYGRLVVSDRKQKLVRGTLNGVDPGVILAAGDYAALDVVSYHATTSTPWSFAGMARVNGGGGRIVRMQVECSVEALAAKWRLTLFHTAPTTSELDDNVAGSITIAEAPNIVCVLETTVDSADLGTLSYASVTPAVPAPFVCASGSTTLYGILQTVDAETGEAAGMTVGIGLMVEWD